MSLLPYLHRVADRRNLSSAEALEAMHIILSGHATAPKSRDSWWLCA
jgi:anthranilate phosphoribosyltransferase